MLKSIEAIASVADISIQVSQRKEAASAKFQEQEDKAKKKAS